MPHPDITYDLTAPRRVARPVSTLAPASATYKEESSSVSVPARRPYQRPQFAPHNCLPLDGVLPHPPTVFAAPPFHPAPSMWATVRWLRTLLSRPLTPLGSRSSGGMTMDLMAPNPNPPRGVVVPAASIPLPLLAIPPR
jgi:hypothetical protein